jgi:nucleotide-binding universal stress UspA family protein
VTHAEGSDVSRQRERRSFAEALLGSVSQHCVHHAHCPVLIMRS